MKKGMANKMLLKVALISLLIRVLYLLQHAASPFFARPFLDQHYYDLCARQLAGMGGDIIDGFRPLLYPLFLSIFYAIGGGTGILLALLAQHALGIGMAVMVAWLARELFEDHRAGFIAGLLFSLSGPPLFFEGELLITTLFSFILLTLWVVVIRAQKCPVPRQRARLWITAGLLLGLAAQARPNALPLLLAFPILAIAEIKVKKVKWPIACMPLLALGGTLSVQLIFGILNAHYSGRFELMSNAGGINFYLGNGLRADGMIPRQSSYVLYKSEHYRDPIQVMAEQEFRQETGATGEVSQKDISAYWKKRTFQEIGQDPARWLRLMVKKKWLMLWNHEVPNNRSYAFAASRETPLLVALPVRWALLVALVPWALAGLIQRRKTEPLIWITSFFILFSGTIILFFVNSRFRIPLWPGMAILGGGGAMQIWSAIREKQHPWKWLCCSAGLFLLSFINLFNIPSDPIAGDYALRSKAYYETGQYEKALADIDAALETVTGNPGYLLQRANVLMALKNNKAAIQTYLRALALNPDDPMLHNNIGIAFENTGQLKKAFAAYSHALKLRPGFRSASVNLMILALRENRTELARETWDQLPSRQYSDAQMQCIYTLLQYRETGDDNFLTKARTLDPNLSNQIIPNAQAHTADY